MKIYKMTIKIIFYMLLLCDSASAICLSTADVIDDCRYAKGDLWCVKNNPSEKFAFNEECLKKHEDNNVATFPTEALLGKDKKWIVIASRPTIEEAKKFAEPYKTFFKDITLLQSANAQYVVTIGIEDYPKAKNILADLISTNKIPKDSFLATGYDLYYVRQNKTPAWKTAYIDKTKNVYVITPNNKTVSITKKSGFCCLTFAEDKQSFAWLESTRVETFDPETHKKIEDYGEHTINAYVFSDNKIRRLEGESFLRDLLFVERGHKIAIEVGALHGAGRSILYDTKSLKKLDEYDESEHAEHPPAWSISP